VGIAVDMKVVRNSLHACSTIRLNARARAHTHTRTHITLNHVSSYFKKGTTDDDWRSAILSKPVLCGMMSIVKWG
jgi:hypothetical protein